MSSISYTIFNLQPKKPVSVQGTVVGYSVTDKPIIQTSTGVRVYSRTAAEDMMPVRTPVAIGSTGGSSSVSIIPTGTKPYKSSGIVEVWV